MPRSVPTAAVKEVATVSLKEPVASDHEVSPTGRDENKELGPGLKRTRATLKGLEFFGRGVPQLESIKRARHVEVVHGNEDQVEVLGVFGGGRSSKHRDAVAHGVLPETKPIGNAEGLCHVLGPRPNSPWQKAIPGNELLA